MKISWVRVAAAFVALCPPGVAHAGEMRVQLTAFVPTTCEMRFQRNVDEGEGGTYTLGDVQQFCNTPYALTLMHADEPAGTQLQLGNRVVSAAGTETIIEGYAPPVNREVQLLAYGVDTRQAVILGGSMMFLVTPRSF
jgi:hypothetical protein